MTTEEVLSEEEKEALLEGVASGELDGDEETAVPPGTVVPYDLQGKNRIERGRMAMLSIINDRFVECSQKGLGTLLQRDVELSSEGIRTVSYGDYVHGLGVPASLNVVRIKPLAGEAIIVFDAQALFSLADYFFGGDGSGVVGDEDRELTASEERVAQLVMEQLFLNLKEAWEPVYPVTLEFVKTEKNPQFANVVADGDPVIVSSFRIGADKECGEIQIGLPVSLLEPVKELLDGGVQKGQPEDEGRQLRALRSRLQEAKIGVRVTFGDTKVSLRDVFDFKKGDVITVASPEFATLLVGNKQMLSGQFGVHNGNNAVKIAKPLVKGL